MNIFEMFETDENLEKDGIWIEMGKTNDEPPKPVRFKIARSGGANDAFLKALDKAFLPYRRQLQTDTYDPKVIEEITRKVFAKTVLLDWENVKDKEGNFIAYSKDNALDLLKRLPKLYEVLRADSENFNLFKQAAREVDVGNSGAS